MRLIDADALSDQYKIEYDHADAMGNAYRKKGWQGALQLLYDAPTIDPSTPRSTGRWVDHLVRDWRCSECGEKIHKVRTVDSYCYDDKPNYCPNCGAKMEG